LLRTMVQTIISHLRECSKQSDAHEPSSHDECFEAVESLPPQERLVYFLREILEYRTRDVSLLLGISDAQVEELLSFAHRRIEESQQTASSVGGYAHWQQFRWTFSNLGRC
jgi:DNA-directed RNA polymerase specialized sigma24 family protein